MKTVLFLGSKPIGYKCFEYLISNSNELDIKILGVLSNDNLRFDASMSVRQLAIDNDIRFIENLSDILEVGKVDFLISVQYHLILKEEHINLAHELAINLHMAPLPEYRGCNQFSFALYNEEKVFGTTIHRLEPGIDSGAIIAESRFSIPENCFVDELYDLTFQHSVSLFERTIRDIVSSNYVLKSQDQFLNERSSHIYFRKDIAKLKSIDLDESAVEIGKKVRATAMPGFEPPFALIDGHKYYIVPEKNYNKENK